MVMVYLPQLLETTFLQRWQGQLESIGYTIAYRPQEGLLVCMMTIRTGTGSFGSVEEKNPQALAKLGRFLRHPNYDVLPTHSHPIEGLSQTDESTLESMAKFGYRNSLVITPTRVRSYNTQPDGTRSESTVLVRSGVYPPHVFEEMDEILGGH